MKGLKLGYMRTNTVNGEVDIYVGRIIKPYEGGIEQAYQGLLESVRRVDNFSKPDIIISKLSVEDVIAMIDCNISDLQVQASALTVYDDDIIAGEIYGSLETLEGLRKNITDKINKGE